MKLGSSSGNMFKFLQLLLLLLCFVCLVGLVERTQAQNTTSNTTTDPSDARALNAVFRKWGISADNTKWNFSGDPCTGAAVGDSPAIEAGEYNPFIKCDCKFNSSTICRIKALKVYSIQVSGPIPDELWSLTYLINLDLGQNMLTGSLSPSIGNLSRIMSMTFGINQLSGPIPEELGTLSKLILLGLGGNNFTGALPSALGNLAMLQQLYIDSSGVTGEIPSTFAALTSLRTVWASDNKFTGRIPDFIGDWKNLTYLKLEGNSFEGPIPSTFSKLTSLVDLRISDLSNASSSLEFIRNMTSLSVLILRDAKISDTIPANMGDYSNMLHLDLSFNNISGKIPNSLFNMSQLAYLFLGSNNLSGTLPLQKSPSLKNIDVSYNNLNGSLPSWATDEQNLQLNPVANNFTLDQTKSSLLPSGLNCLQSDFPCFRGSPLYSQFAVKCGGPQIKSASGIVYENDTNAVGPSTYYVTNSKRWAVSTTGFPKDNNKFQYTLHTLTQFTGTMDSEIFQSARISPSSLRYYGLGLENGNYSVLLQFAEIAISADNTKWESTGRRVFDIYLQGVRVAKDFNIRDEAGGRSMQPVSKSFNTTVEDNHMEIHLRWAGKGTCCIPIQATFGPLISAISVTPNFVPSVSNQPPGSKKDKTAVIAGAVVPSVLLVLAIIGFLWFVAYQKRKLREKADEELRGIDNKPNIFTYAELRAATDGFSSANKLGEGGFGPVFKGKLSDGREIAVKQLSMGSAQGKTQFVTEIAAISAVQHKNLVKLYGCCIDGNNRLVVYEYLENKSIEQMLFGKSQYQIDWDTRYDICLGIARGLAYLHEESRVRIVHRDVKASNILLDSDLVPKISDFGLAKLFDQKQSHLSTHVAGTYGYLAPEYAMRGHLTEKADVFAFGVVLLEIISGRPSQDNNQEREKIYLLEWAWTLHENNQEDELVDSRLDEFDSEQAKRLLDVALLCTQTSPLQRPPMSRVVAMMSGDIEVGSVTSRPGYLADWKFDGETFTTHSSITNTSRYGFSTNASTVDVTTPHSEITDGK